MVKQVTKRMRIPQIGVKPISYPSTYKGKKVTPSIYKVRTKPNGDKSITVGLYYQNKGKRALWKNLMLTARLVK